MMLTKLVRIGNSRGVRLPKALLQAAGVKGEVKIFQKGNSIVIIPVRPKPKKAVRVGWEEDAAALVAAGPDPEPLMDFPNEWDLAEWEW